MSISNAGTIPFPLSLLIDRWVLSTSFINDNQHDSIDFMQIQRSFPENYMVSWENQMSTSMSPNTLTALQRNRLGIRTPK